MARNAIKSDFRSSKMVASSHFVKKKKLHIDLKWREMRWKVIYKLGRRGLAPKFVLVFTCFLNPTYYDTNLSRGNYIQYNLYKQFWKTGPGQPAPPPGSATAANDSCSSNFIMYFNWFRTPYKIVYNASKMKYCSRGLVYSGVEERGHTWHEIMRWLIMRGLRNSSTHQHHQLANPWTQVVDTTRGDVTPFSQPYFEL